MSKHRTKTDLPDHRRLDLACLNCFFASIQISSYNSSLFFKKSILRQGGGRGRGIITSKETPTLPGVQRRSSALRVGENSSVFFWERESQWANGCISKSKTKFFYFSPPPPPPPTDPSPKKKLRKCSQSTLVACPYDSYLSDHSSYVPFASTRSHQRLHHRPHHWDYNPAKSRSARLEPDVFHYYYRCHWFDHWCYHLLPWLFCVYTLS